MPTLQIVLDEYCECKRLRPRTEKQYRAFLKRSCDDWLEMEVTGITKHMMIQKYNSVMENVTARATSGGKGQANGLFRVLRALFRWAEIFYDIKLLNPIAAVRSMGTWEALKDRDTLLRIEDLPVWYRQINELPAVDRDYYICLVLTGCRADELAALEWDEVDLEKGLLHLPPPRTKGKKWHHQPIARQVLYILRERRLLSNRESAFVFSTPDDPKGQYSLNRRAYLRVERMIGIDCNPHALRRTFATHARYACGIDRFLIKQCLNHTMVDVTERYMVKDPEVLRGPFQKVADFLMLKMRGEKPRMTLGISS